MRYLGSMIALVALTASAPALASDYSPDRHLTRDSATNVQSPDARPRPRDARNDQRPCACSCSRRTVREHAGAPRVEPGGH